MSTGGSAVDGQFVIDIKTVLIVVLGVVIGYFASFRGQPTPSPEFKSGRPCICRHNDGDLGSTTSTSTVQAKK